MRKIIVLLTLILSITAACFTLGGCQNKGDESVSGADAERSYNIVLSATELEIEVGESAVLHASYGSEAVSFESSDNSVATVSANGEITAKSAGTAYIRVKADGKETVCKVNAVKNDWTIEIDCESAITAVNSLNKEFRASVRKNGEETTETVVWTITGGGKLFVEENEARVYVEGAGTYTLTATFKKTSASVVITVIAK